MAVWRYNRRPGFATATRAPRQRPSPSAPTSSPIAVAMTLTAFAVLWDYGLLLMLLYNMRPGTPAFTVLSTVFNLLCAAFDFVCYNFMGIIQFFLSIPIAVVVGYLNIDPAAIKYDVLYVRNACSRAVHGYLVAQRERARMRAVAAWHRGCGYVDYQRKLHCWYADNICAMSVGSIEGRIRDIMDDCTTFIYLTPPLAETYMTVWQAWLWLLWMRDGASLLMSYLPAFHTTSPASTSTTKQPTPNASRSTTPVSDNEAPASNSSQPTTPEPQPSSENESPRTNPATESERAERRERRERKKREERAARKREADLRAARSKEERERRQLQERLAREAEQRRLEQEAQERQRKAREQAAREEERQRKAQEQADSEKERQRKAQEQAALEKERQRKAYEQAALEKARSQSTAAGQLLKQAIAKAATEQKTKPQPTVPLAPAGAASVQLPKTLPPVVLQKTTGPTLPFSLSAVPSMTTNPPRTPSTASTQPPPQPIPQTQSPVLQQQQTTNLQPRLGQGQNVPQQLRPQPQQSAVGAPAGSIASPSGPQAFPTFFANGTARQRAAAGLPFPISAPTSAPAVPVTLAPPASALPSQPQQQHRTPEEFRLTVLARIAALKQEAQQVQPQPQPQQQPQQSSTQFPIFNAQRTPISIVAKSSAASGQPTLFPANTVLVNPSSNQIGILNGGLNGAPVGSSMPAFSSSITRIHPVNIPQPQAIAEPMEIDTPTPFIHDSSPPPESDLMDIDDIEMEDAWQAECSATSSSDILPLFAPTMEVDDGWPESCPSPQWLPLETPQPSRPVTPASLSPPPTAVRSPEIVMEVVAALQNARTPPPVTTPPVATPPKASHPRQVTAPTTFSVPLKPTSTASVPTSSVTPKPAQGPSSSTPPKATLNASTPSATPAKPTDPPKAPAPAPAAAKADSTSIAQSRTPAKPSSVTPPASQAVEGKSTPSVTSSTTPRTPGPSGPSPVASSTASTSMPSAPRTTQSAISTTQKPPSSSPPAAPRIDAGGVKVPASTSPAKTPPKKFGFATTRKAAEKKEVTEDKPILFKDKRQFPLDANKPTGPSVAPSKNAAKGQPTSIQPRPRTSILRPAPSTSTPTSADVKMSSAPSPTSSPSPARPAPVGAACNTTTAASSSSSNSAFITGSVNTAQSSPSSSSSSSTGTDSVMGNSSSSSAAPAPSAPTPMPSPQADNNGAPARRPVRDLPKTFGIKKLGEYEVATPIVDPGETEFQNADQDIAKAADAASNSSQANPNLARADAMFDDDDDDDDDDEKKNDEFVDFELSVNAVDPNAPIFASPVMESWTDPTSLSLTTPAPAVSQQGLASSSTSTPTSTQPTYASSSSPSSAPSDPSSFPPGRPNPAIRLVPLKHNHPTTSAPSSAPPGQATDMETLCLRQFWEDQERKFQEILRYGAAWDLQL